jgi:hypothetical protein
MITDRRVANPGVETSQRSSRLLACAREVARQARGRVVSDGSKALRRRRARIATTVAVNQKEDTPCERQLVAVPGDRNPTVEVKAATREIPWPPSRSFTRTGREARLGIAVLAGRAFRGSRGQRGRDCTEYEHRQECSSELAFAIRAIPPVSAAESGHNPEGPCGGWRRM